MDLGSNFQNSKRQRQGSSAMMLEVQHGTAKSKLRWQNIGDMDNVMS